MENMSAFLNSVPPFWEGVLASLVAALIFAILVALLRIFSGTARNWSDQKLEAKRKLIHKLKEGNDLDKSQASLTIIFHVLKWLFLGNLLWMISDSVLIGYFIESVVVTIYVASRVFALISFILGMRWVMFYARNS